MNLYRKGLFECKILCTSLNGISKNHFIKIQLKIDKYDSFYKFILSDFQSKKLV